MMLDVKLPLTNDCLPCRLMRRFRNPQIAALLSFQDLYVGLSPYTAPGVFSLLAATEITDAVWYPLGGFGKVGGATCKQASLLYMACEVC